MKVCPVCHKKKKIVEFREHCGGVIITNEICVECLGNIPHISQEESNRLIQGIAKRLFA